MLRTSSSVLALSLGLLPASAFAQATAASGNPPVSATPDAAASRSSEAAGDGLTDIVVTARRRAEPLQRTPVAVSAITAADIASKHAVTIVDVGKSIPNVRIDSVGSQGRAGMLSIRGVNYARPDMTGDPSVAFYVDGLYQTRSTLNILDLFDIESIEVLRGPQGTLFGRNAFAGAVNIQSKRPDLDRFGGEAEARIGNFGRHELRAALNVPIVADALAMRVSGFYGKSDGYYHLINQGGKSFGGDDNITGKVSFLWTPSDSWSIFLKYEHVRDRSDPTPNKNSSRSTQLFGNLPGDPPNLNIGGRYDVNFNLPKGQRSFVDLNNVVLNVTKDLEGGSLNLISGYQAARDGLITDPGSGNQPYLNSYYRTRVDAYSQEARFTHEIGDIGQFIVGAYYQRDEVTYGAITYSTYRPLLGTNAQVDTKQNRDSWAIFGELELRPIDRVRVNFAGRQMWEDKEFFFLRRLRSSAMDFADFLPKPATYARDNESWTNFSPKISADWRPTDDIMLYASWTRGFKSGGFASISTSIAAAGPYDPEKIETYEVGIKSFLFDRKIRLNLTGFWNNIDDLQRQVNFTVNGVTNNLVFNAASAVTKGFEAELETRPVRDLTLRASAGYTDAYYKRFCAAFGLPGTACNDGANGGAGTSGAVDNSRLKLYNAPKWQFSGGGNYEVELGDIGSLTFFADVSYTSALFTTDNNLDSRRGPMTLVDTSFQWTSANKNVYATIFVQNLFNEIDVQQQIRAGNTLSILNYTPPRRYGASVGIKF
ncbi:TonB-dependent receptor [Sphingomonas profundi]|uniref:TonB-dependent receptor n=1 Tax=Alterirhizorhabdus profundi TaxID=2681549 RepID=UPI0012E82600|nr:TonB-dependent receptor [Sphingomonas profundi]